MRFLAIMLIALVPGIVFADELQLPAEQIEAGQALYMKKCRRCHGRLAMGANAPDIQGMLLKDVLQASQGVENMPKIVLQDAEAEQIATFLMSLAPEQARIRLGLE